MENSVEFPQNPKTRNANNPTSGYISETVENRIPKSYLHSRFHCTTIHGYQDTGITRCPSIEGWIQKIRAVSTHLRRCGTFRKVKIRECPCTTATKRDSNELRPVYIFRLSTFKLWLLKI